MALVYIKDNTKIIVEAGQTSDIFILRGQITAASITVTFPDGSGSGLVQTTDETIPDLNEGIDIDLGTSLVWLDWAKGTVTATTNDVLVAKTSAIRFINSGATRVKFNIAFTF